MSASKKSYVPLQQRGVLTIPAELRRRLDLDRPGALVELAERADGVIELRPVVPVAADQAWFWSERWQAMEREVDRHLEKGEVRRYESVEDLFADLDRADG